jgi:transposase InsO family protein
MVDRILELRKERNQCAEILHHRLSQEGIQISLSSVKRILKRYGLRRYSPWKKWHQYPPRPLPEKPGVLVQVDTLFDGPPQERLSAYALLDVCSRWGYALAAKRVNTHQSLGFVVKAQNGSPFSFQTLQSDHGPEFSKWFTKQLKTKGVAHRHSRIRTPTDNAHVERFIRTLQEECLNRIPRKFSVWRKELPEYLVYYNIQRPHMALGMKTPLQVITSY